DALELAARVVDTLEVHPDKMKAAVESGFMTATDLADELVRRGVPFAEAHEQVGKLVRYCSGRNTGFAALSTAEAERFIPAWDATLAAIAKSPEKSVARKAALGGDRKSTRLNSSHVS